MMATVNLITTPLAVHNLHGPDNSVNRRHQSITALLNAAKGGLGGFNELNKKDWRFLKAEAAERSLRVSIVGLNGVVWDPKIFKVGKPRVKKIMKGGHVGADGVATKKKGDDDRRVGPNRYCLYYPCEVIVFRLDFELDATHLMARAFTAHRWRIPLFRRSIISLAAGVLEENGLLFGDMNTGDYINLPGVSEVPVPVPPDMGNRRLTQILRWGSHIFVSGVKTVNTSSDHHLLAGKVVFYRLPQKKIGSVPKPNASNLPHPGHAGVRWRHYGSPVNNPWLDRSAKFKRRRRRLWNRIVKWRAAYRRRL